MYIFMYISYVHIYIWIYIIYTYIYMYTYIYIYIYVNIHILTCIYIYIYIIWISRVIMLWFEEGDICDDWHPELTFRHPCTQACRYQVWIYVYIWIFEYHVSRCYDCYNCHIPIASWCLRFREGAMCYEWHPESSFGSVM